MTFSDRAFGSLGLQFSLILKGLRPDDYLLIGMQFGLQFSLILKGLRHKAFISGAVSNRSAVFPDTEGIETQQGHRHSGEDGSAVFPDTEGIETSLVRLLMRTAKVCSFP